MTYKIPNLPLENFKESPKILKKAISANKAIAEIKGLAQTIPNQVILINTLSIQESKDSSEVENIMTTHDELFRYDKKEKDFSPEAKEVYRYNDALFYGFKELKTKPITNNLLIKISKIITEVDAGFRNAPGTNLKNEKTGEIVYVPPQNNLKIQKYMRNLEDFINKSELSDFDPLVKMAIIHHQFESIHPFFDGNGRTGRILNILYLMSENLLEMPILYLSRYITNNKEQYYALLQDVRDNNNWEDWILFMLSALETTAKQTVSMIEEIKKLMMGYKVMLKEKAPNIYSHELINNIFSYPYAKIEYVMKDLNVSRVTASKYLKRLEEIGLLKMTKHKNSKYYINEKLLNLFLSL